ncbi:hypothetical protein FISHEDRAFT_48408 [Fistulina hepatica ATCC 64428]|uniref:Nucleoside transporter n=1 Tax=Fistulina hepatica ATCC 64428 TaxID=1128425 RepID=A0A0D7A4K7_9AGAR|nr:hypothetical protein FISHEDRAFT_48408 [Fistulina hepatica ATCC 64428]
MLAPTSDVAYQAIPQAPPATPLDPSDESDVELSESLHLARSASSTSPDVVDSRIRWLHVIFGCAVLLPWNILLTATPYFISNLDGSSYQRSFTSYLSSGFMTANFCFLAHATIISKKHSPSRQTFLTLVGLACLTFLLTMSTFMRLSPTPFFVFVMVNAICQSALGSYLQTSVIAVASLFGPAALQSLMVGQAAVAVAINVVHLISVWGFVQRDSTTENVDRSPAGESRGAENQSAFVFFALSTIFLVVAAAAQLWLASLPVYKTVAAPLERVKEVDDDPLLFHGHHGAHSNRNRILRVARANTVYEVAVAYVFVVTLAVFPPITILVESTSPSTHPLLFSAAHFLMFGVGDLVGRYLCSFPRFLVWSDRRLLALSLARTLFIPLFLLCNVQGHDNALIRSDIAFMIILFAFSVSNGHVSSCCMMASSSLQHNPRLTAEEDVDVAATVASFFLVGGLAVGSIASFVVRGVACSCNPFVQ